MASHLRLQDVITVSANETQEREFAADIGPYNYVTVQVRILNAATSGALTLEHAAVNEDSAYIATSISVSADSSTNTTGLIEHGLRFLRWRTENLNGAVTFLIDIIARV